MRLISFGLALTFVASTQAAAQKGSITYNRIAGTWAGKTMMGPKDSVVTTSTSVITADGKISFELPNRPKMTGKVIAMGGDSVTTEFGPYDSVLRPGKQVTTRTTLHYKGDNATGTFTAKYADGETRAGKTSAKRTKK